MLIKSTINRQIYKKIYTTWYTRWQSTAVNVTESVRQKAWQAAQQRYSNYDYIHYSSFLECQLASVNNFRRHQENLIYPPLEVLSNLEPGNNIENTPKAPNNWLDEYEFYEGSLDESGNIDSKYGTSIPSMPPSKVPCNGCGAHLHCASSTLPGYIPSEIFKGRSNNELKTITCQRCHFLKHYNIALDIEVPHSSYIDTISQIKDKFALAIVIIDLLDFPCSIWPDMQKILGSKRPIFIVGNKVDLLPRDSNNYLNNVKSCLQQQFIEHGGFNSLNIKHVSLISAKTGYGIEELITQLHKIWQYKGDVYLLGCTNVGKSTLFNILLNSDYCRPEATQLVRQATTCPWPGTTLQLLKFPILRPSELRVYQRFRRLFSERTQRAALEKLRRDQARESNSVALAQLVGKVGKTFNRHEEVTDAFSMASGTQPISTLNERASSYREARWVYDTPGVMQPEQLTSLLTTEELLRLQATQMIRPRAYRIKPNMSLLIAGLARIDLLSCESELSNIEWIKIFVFASPNLPVMIIDTEHSDFVYKRYLGTSLMGIPLSGGDETRLQRWPGLTSKKEDIVVKSLVSNGSREERKLDSDIVLSSAGWVGLQLPENTECRIRAWTPDASGIFVRNPALIPLANRLIGKHVRNSLAYHMGKPFVFKK